MDEAGSRKRLDQVMVERGLARSRASARDLILRGEVAVAGQPCAKPAMRVAADAPIDVDPDVASRVSRGGDKLAAGLDHFGVDVTGALCLDLGASTGGFSQELLERGAARVFAVDVGHGQLDDAIASDARVTNLEGLDARALDGRAIGEPVDLIVADLSFISLTLALPAALDLAGPGAWLVALVKPQFELEPKAIGKGGVVRSQEDLGRAIAKVESWMGAQPGWQVRGIMESPISGAGGNREFILAAQSALQVP